MNVGRLRQLIANLPDDAQILVSGRDHVLVPGDAYVSEVVPVRVSKREVRFYHSYDYEETPDYDAGPPTSALVIE